MTESAPAQRLRWQCRRGMLELDLLLHAFVERGLADLNAEQHASFVRLLEFPDPILYDWLMGLRSPPEPALHELITHILSATP